MRPGCLSPCPTAVSVAILTAGRSPFTAGVGGRRATGMTRNATRGYIRVIRIGAYTRVRREAV